MVAWKEYEWEWETFKDLEQIKVPTKKIKLIVNKLSKHFKIGKIDVYTDAYKNGHAYWFRQMINIPKEPSLLLLSHEVSHILAHKRYGERCYHNKKFKHEAKRVYNYVRKKNYFNLSNASLALSAEQSQVQSLEFSNATKPLVLDSSGCSKA